MQNHDTERNGDALNYKDGATNILANQYLLASGYGRTQVYSAFQWTNADDSPPATADGMITDTTAAPAGSASTATRACRRWSAGTTTWVARRGRTGGTTAPT